MKQNQLPQEQRPRDLMIQVLESLARGETLQSQVAESTMRQILLGEIAIEQTCALLTALYFKPPSSAALVGFANAIRAQNPIKQSIANDDVIDVCGTGGDGLGTFNISTSVAFVLASIGQAVAKHGNRAVSSKCGSFDVIEACGISFAESGAAAESRLAQHHLAFIYAPSFSPALKLLAPMRKALGIRTILNALGPLLNPLRVRRQLVGVYAPDLLIPMAEALAELGSQEAMIVHGDDGSDEISLCTPTTIAHLKDRKIKVTRIQAEDFGFKSSAPHCLHGGDAQLNAQIIGQIFTGEKGPKRDVVILNAAAALLVSGRAQDIKDGIGLAENAIDSGAAKNLLETMRDRHEP